MGSLPFRWRLDRHWGGPGSGRQWELWRGGVEWAHLTSVDGRVYWHTLEGSPRNTLNEPVPDGVDPKSVDQAKAACVAHCKAQAVAARNA